MRSRLVLFLIAPLGLACSAAIAQISHGGPPSMGSQSYESRASRFNRETYLLRQREKTLRRGYYRDLERDPRWSEGSRGGPPHGHSAPHWRGRDRGR